MKVQSNRGKRTGKRVRLSLTATLLALSACSVDDPTLQGTPGLSLDTPRPNKESIGYSENRNLLWGDMHVHTSLSYDAYTMGVRVLPDDAYHYMKGGTISHGAGYLVRAKRPLDFAAITDHAEYLGGPRHLAGDQAQDNALPAVLASGNPLKITWHWLYTMVTGQMNNPSAVYGELDLSQVSRAAWQQIISAAERHNEPGRFTTFIAYEWTSMPGGQNLHRNVIFKGTQVPELPFSAIDSENPEDLWSTLEAQRKQGMDNFAIPHNANASNGLMYDRQSHEGNRLDANYAQRRMANEPLSEIFQVKGSSETHPELSPDDPFAAHELFTTIFNAAGDTGKVPGSYARDALRTGLELNHSEGFNPYQFGVIGSSDSHNGMSADEEDNFHGKQPIMDGTAAQRLGEVFLMPDEMRRTGQWGSQGLAAVWAQENTRDSLFDAMQRKETYATTGPRISLRFFGGWDFNAELLNNPDWVTQAYAQGQPMGAVLTPAHQQEAALTTGVKASTDSPQTKSETKTEQTAPRFILFAAKDPISANLDRLQVIKAWVDNNGKSHEKIFDVAASANRKINPDTGLFNPVGNSVNISDARYENNIGSTQLSAHWQDPEFDPQQQAFYYARVIEIPTPRYSTFDAKALGIAAPTPATIQERAVSSAIWYQP